MKATGIVRKFDENGRFVVPIELRRELGITNRDERMNRRQAVGSVVAFVGMVLVVLNGKFALKLSPVGDLLAFAAAWSWAFYSLITKRLSTKYNNLFIIYR